MKARFKNYVKHSKQQVIKENPLKAKNQGVFFTTLGIKYNNGTRHAKN